MSKKIALTSTAVLAGLSALGLWDPSHVIAASALESRATPEPAYPTRPIRIIVGFPPGSGTDMLARFVGGKLTERLGQQVIVDNRAGANGIIGAELTASICTSAPKHR